MAESSRSNYTARMPQPPSKTLFQTGTPPTNRRMERPALADPLQAFTDTRNEQHVTQLLAPLIPHGTALLRFRAAKGRFGPLRFTSSAPEGQPNVHPDERLLLATEQDGETFTCMVSNAAGDYRVYPGALDLLHEHLTRDGRIHLLTAQATVEYLNAQMYGLFDTPGGHSELLLGEIRDVTNTTLNASVTLTHTGGFSAKLLLRVDSGERPELRLSKAQHPEPVAWSQPRDPAVAWHPQYAQAFRKAAQA